MKKLSGMLNLELAWRRVKSDLYNDFIPDLIGFKDIDYDIKTTLSDIRNRIDEGYQPSNILGIDQPKRGFTLRPASMISIEDRIVYQALIDFISQRAEEPPEKACYSYRINQTKYSKRMFKFWKNSWLEMKKKMREIYDAGEHRCLLRTDIAAYFEHIDQSILRAQILNGEIKETSILNLLETLLRKWAVSETKSIGIPQGCDASSYIGNLYLRDVDKTMIRDGFKYFRYSDEMYILTKNEQEARRAIMVLTHQLRNLHLNLQEAKTKIIEEPAEIREEIGTEEEDKIKVFDYEFRAKKKPKKRSELPKEITDRYKKITKNGRAKVIDVSKFKWCVNKFIAAKSDLAVNYMLNRLTDMPFLADFMFQYLSLFANRKQVKGKITAFLKSRDNIYHWQEMWMLLTLSKARALTEEQIEIVREIVRNKEKHWASRSAAIFVLGNLGDVADRKWLRGQYYDEEHPCIKRAIAIGLHKYSKAARNKFYSEIESDSYDISRLVKYLKQDKIETI